MYINKENKTKKIFEKILVELQAIVNRGDYEKFLKFQKNFRDYSFNNLILVFSQYPEATKVAGKVKWQKLKRELTENAQKIWIIAPIPKQYKKKVKSIKEGKEVEELETIKYNDYRYVYVYDISHTKGEPFPLQCKNINSNNMSVLYEKLKLFSHIPVIEKELFNGVKGYYSKAKQEIAIKSNMSLDDKSAVLIHEITHSLYDDFDYSKDQDLSEVFVESVAYIVADYFYLDTSLCSFNYIIKWAKGNPKLVLELGSKIQTCANSFIKKLENFEMQELKLVA